MAQKSGFFNARLINGEYDRKYNAQDYSDNLAVVISDGVLRSSRDDLKVTTDNSVINVNAGRAWIGGHYYLNEQNLFLTAVTAPSSNARWDRVVLRLDNNIGARSISLQYLQGTPSASPVKPSLIRTSMVWDLCLADVYVSGNGIIVTDTREDRSVCGWVYSVSGDNSFFTSLDNAFYTWFGNVKDTLSSVTLFKRYDFTGVLETDSAQFAFTIPQWDPDVCFLDVYVNGMLDTNNTVSGSVLTFDSILLAGTEITVNVYKSIDGTGIESVSDEITALQNQVAGLNQMSKFIYRCSGVDDNIALSEIALSIHAGAYVNNISNQAKAFLDALGGSAYLAVLPSDAKIEIKVVGSVGCTHPYYSGESGYTFENWFDFGSKDKGSDKTISFDFSCANPIHITASSERVFVFLSEKFYIKSADVFVVSTFDITKHALMFAQGFDNNSAQSAVYGIIEDCNINMNFADTTIEDDVLICNNVGDGALSIVSCNSHIVVDPSATAAYAYAGYVTVIGGSHIVEAITTPQQTPYIFGAGVLASSVRCPAGDYMSGYVTSGGVGSLVGAISDIPIQPQGGATTTAGVVVIS